MSEKGEAARANARICSADTKSHDKNDADVRPDPAFETLCMIALAFEDYERDVSRDGRRQASYQFVASVEAILKGDS